MNKILKKYFYVKSSMESSKQRDENIGVLAEGRDRMIRLKIYQLGCPLPQ